MICKEWNDRIQTILPLSDGKRFLLLTELLHLVPWCRPSEAETFKRHAKLLRDQTDLNRFVNVEMRSRNIFLQSGLSGLLMYSVNAHSPLEESCHWHIENRILQSPVWDEWKKRSNEEEFFFALMNSLTGVIYAYQQFFSNLQQ